jgi:uncharacterized LabA/DUF88 family protein
LDRCAVFVDAGYLYAEGGKLCCDTPGRRTIRLDAAGCVELLVELARARCDLPVLRTYWYDGARNGVPTPEHQQIAALANVKVRLGGLTTKNRQKGVDALIYRDLMTLSRERAISDAFVLAGDEDLREGVRSAQDMGVRVTVVGITPAVEDFNQSRELLNEADEVIVLERHQLAPFFGRMEILRGSSRADSVGSGQGARPSVRRTLVGPRDGRRAGCAPCRPTPHPGGVRRSAPWSMWRNSLASRSGGRKSFGRGRVPGSGTRSRPRRMPGAETMGGHSVRVARVAEVDGNRTRRTGIARPTRFEGGGAHQVPGHLRLAG